MSLLDDVSIVVTPNGYKAGELYAVVPVPTEGAEEVTNGDFSGSSTGWSESGTWTYGNNNEVCTGNGTNQMLTQSGILTSGKLYTYSIDIISSSLSSQEIRVYVGSTDYITHTLSGVAETISGNTVSSGANLVIRVTSSNTSGVLTIDNVSVKEYTSADMDVTRATAGTRVDENGLVNYAEVIGSEEVTNGDFTQTPLGTGWTVTDTDADNYVVFDGSTARLKFLNTSPLTQLSSSFSFTSGKTYKLVVDIASVTSGGVKVDASGISELFNTVGINTRIVQPTGNFNLAFYRATSNVDLTFNSVSVKEVTRDNVPRIDYTGGGCPHILAEPQRTNLITYSEDFTQWSSKINIDVTLNSETSPDGVVNATFINENNSNAQHFIGQSLSITNGQDISISVYAKKNQRDVLQISPSGNYLSTSGYANYDLNNGLVTASGGGVTAEIEGLTNGWFRCVAKFTANNTASGATAFFLQNSTTASRGSSYDGDGTSGLYMWGAQTEIGSYPTSYIPTSGSTVTRNQDIFTRDGIGSLINSTEGVLFVEFKTLYETGSFRQFNLFKDTSNRIYITKRGDNGSLECRMENPSGSLNFSFTQNTTNDFVKVAFRYGLNNFAVFIDGVNKNVTSTGNVFASGTLNTLEFDSPIGQTFYGKVRQLQVYNTALTDAQLTSLTS